MSTFFPPAPPGSFRLFRLLALYPIPRIYLQTFQCPSNENLSHHEPHLSLLGSHAGDLVGFPCPAYDAISYAWNSSLRSNSRFGQDDVEPVEWLPTQPITVTVPGYEADFTLYITNNLFCGLVTVHELCTPTWLFADAICIDQTDVTDKAAQVQSMGRVFQGAQRVLIWLGMDSDSNFNSGSMDGTVLTTAANPDMALGACLSRIPSLVQVLEAYWESCKRDQKQHDHNKKGTRHLAVAAVDLISEHNALWSALERLRSNPWFFRLWVVQEVILSQNAILVYGNETLSWSEYTKFTALCENITTSLFSKKHDSKLVDQIYLACNSRVSAMMKLQAQRSRLRSPSHGVEHDSLPSAIFTATLIQTIRTFQTAIPVDKVYAILGILDTQMQQSISVDYSDHLLDKCGAKWLELFQVLLLLVPTVAEDVFWLAASLQPHPDLPSWCPNLVDNTDKSMISGGSRTCAGMPQSRAWKAPEDTRVAEVILGTSYLRLLGLRVDEVAHVIDLSWIETRLQWSTIINDEDHRIDSELAQEMIATLWRCIQVMRELGVSMSNADAILAKCLITNTYDDQIVNFMQVQQDYMGFAKWLEHYIWGATACGPLKSSIKTAALRFGNRFQHMAKQRAFFVTRAGRSGLCSSKAREGDALCVFMNFRSPYLLRSRNDAMLYESIGETYVDGLMYGEAFKDHDMNKEIPGEFIIS